MIQVLHNYGGKNTNEKRILPGVYHEDDPALFGLAAYLVEHKHAVIVNASPYIQREPVYAPNDPTFHNEIMRKKGRTEAIIPVTPVAPVTESTTVDLYTDSGGTFTEIPPIPSISTLTMDELRAKLPEGILEEDIVTNINAHWRVRRDELIAWFEKG